MRDDGVIKTKICTRCHIEKSISEFYIINKFLKTLKSECKKCGVERVKNWCINNKEQSAKHKKKYKNNNKNKISEESHKYYINNKNVINAKANDRNKIKRKTNPNFRLKSNVSRSIRLMITSKNNSKNKNSILNYLLYNINELKLHIESQWESWMTWENYGIFNLNKKTWNIDHIIPQSLLPYDSMDDFNFQKSWSFSNLRPLEAAQNNKKNNNISNKLYNETMKKINLELEERANNNSEFKIKLEKWKFEEKLNSQKQFIEVG